MAAAIVNFDRDDGRLKLAWDDGSESAHHFIWLRDNCGCSACGDKVSTSGERFLRLTDVPADIAPAEVAVGADSEVMIKLTATLPFAEPDWKGNDARGEESTPSLWT